MRLTLCSTLFRYTSSVVDVPVLGTLPVYDFVPLFRDHRDIRCDTIVDCGSFSSVGTLWPVRTRSGGAVLSYLTVSLPVIRFVIDGSIRLCGTLPRDCLESQLSLALGVSIIKIGLACDITDTLTVFGSLLVFGTLNSRLVLVLRYSLVLRLTPTGRYTLSDRFVHLIAIPIFGHDSFRYSILSPVRTHSGVSGRASRLSA